MVWASDVGFRGSCVGGFGVVYCGVVGRMFVFWGSDVGILGSGVGFWIAVIPTPSRTSDHFLFRSAWHCLSSNARTSLCSNAWDFKR